MKRQLPSIVLLTAMSFLLPRASYSAEAMQKIRVGVPSLALSYMPFYVAQDKGFLKKSRPRSRIHSDEHGLSNPRH